VEASVKIAEDGTVHFLDESGGPLSNYLVGLAKRQKGDEIRAKLTEICDRMNEETTSLALLHCHTPPPSTTGALYPRREFPQPEPREPSYRRISFVDRLLFRRRGIERDNKVLRQHYQAAVEKWTAVSNAFYQREHQKAAAFSQRLQRGDLELMHEVLEREIADIRWPRETLIAFDIIDGGKGVAMDVDLPEIEDLDRKVASVPARCYKLTLKEMTTKARQELYAKHVHSVGFRLIGEVFATLPTIEGVTLSGYTQRPDGSTGHLRDEYVYSVRVCRPRWAEINFTNLAALDIVGAFERFDLRRKLSKSGLLGTIEPFAEPLE